MKRIISLATVAALMAVMLVMSAAPAVFAHNVICKGENESKNASTYYLPGHPTDADGDGYFCGYIRGNTQVFQDDYGYAGP
jgi:hypothetical protein